ncbi:MAG: Gfo/Idh/MocA family oxidoreductase, partial [Myxococcales bacterium]|nr:Gfo/Idh/MocA family oxidoreductase [Myxococcales bacterium]
VLAANWTRAERREVPLTLPHELSEPTRPAGREGPNAVLFGYGNYAKTVMLPAVRRHLRVDAIHEVDPTQMPLRRSKEVRWDTSPTPRPDESADAFLIAGFHHTHAPLAVDALRRGAAAVIEKPVATTRSQLRELLVAQEETGGRVFSCFQRRYTPFNDLARRHLRTAPGDPINYHCIAYEVPNPELHWYRWQNSGSRLVSNGCHWLDHFLYLNDWSPVQTRQIASSPDGTLNCFVTLANGACFNMVLTDAGSKRTGMQDHVELRANGVTVRIRDTARYHAEDGARTLGRARTTRLDSYRRMYESIAERIVRGEPGDSKLAVQASTQLVLNLEADLQHRTLQQGTAFFEGLGIAAA